MGVFQHPLIRVDSAKTDTFYWAPFRCGYAETIQIMPVYHCKPNTNSSIKTLT